MRNIGIGFDPYGFALSDEETMRLLKSVGFTCFFCSWHKEIRAEHVRELAEKYGLTYESIRAPFSGIRTIWEDCAEGEEWVKRLCRTVDRCQRFGVKYMTVRAMNLPQYNSNTQDGSAYTLLGAERFARVAEYAGERGVKMSLENVEFPQKELLSLLSFLEVRGLGNAVGVTYDVGHWNCYPCDLDFAEAFGKYLIGTHVHDNFGQTDPTIITWNDDCHLLPFDGTLDYKFVADTLKRCDYHGSIMLEIARREPVAWDSENAAEIFFQTAYERACRVASLCDAAF